MTFDEMVSAIKESKETYVDSRKYKSGWGTKWVMYCDLIGFANMCMKSNDSTVNVITRFHRAISRAKASLTTSKVYQFTDASFCVGENKFEVLGFAIEVAQLCLAHNRALLDSKQNPLFHQMIVPRITIASGEILLLDGSEEPDLLSGLNKDSFLAGSAIVRAYYLEGKTFAGAIAMNGDDFADIIASVNIRGDNNSITKTIKLWQKQSQKDIDILKKGIVELPWPMFSSVSGIGEIWSDSKTSFFAKVQTLSEISDKMAGEFVSCNLDLGVGKHQVGLQRYIFNLLCILKRQRKFDLDKFKSPNSFLSDL